MDAMRTIPLDPCWCLLEQLLPVIKSVAARMSWGDKVTREARRQACLDEAVHRWPKLLETWQPDRAPLAPYVIMSLRWYFSKLKPDQSKHTEQDWQSRLDSQPCTRPINLAASETVLDFLADLPQDGFDRQILRLYYLERYTHAELANWLTCSESQARLLVIRAHSRACALRCLRLPLKEIGVALRLILSQS